VIEPSFGLGRILYSILEGSFYYRENDAKRTVLQLPYAIAPIKVSFRSVVCLILSEIFVFRSECFR
jgi:glycyl-tRNA synthetase (class II)